MVQLLVENLIGNVSMPRRFQFHYGSIISFDFQCGWSVSNKFQFHYGSIISLLVLLFLLIVP